MIRADGAGVYNAAVARGDAFIFNVRVPGADWTADTFTGQVRASPDATGMPIASFSFTPPVLDGSDTTFVATVSGSTIWPDADVLGEDVKLYYDIKRDNAGMQSTLMAGTFTIIGLSLIHI